MNIQFTNGFWTICSGNNPIMVCSSFLAAWSKLYAIYAGFDNV